MYKITPLNDIIMIEDERGETLDSGIVLSDDNSFVAKVLAVPDGDFKVKPGDRISYLPHTLFKRIIDGKEYSFIFYKSIVAIIAENND